MPYILSVSRITIDTSSVKKHFTATESFTYSGLIVWAHYDDIYNNIQDAIDPQNVTSSAVVTATPWKPGIISVSVKYVDPQSGKSFFKYYNVDKNGISDFRVDITGLAQYDSINDCIKVEKGKGINWTGLTAEVRRYNNAEEGGWTTISGGSVTKSSVDTDTIGTKEVTFTYTEDGYSLSVKKTVQVVDTKKFKQYKVVNAQKEFYIKDGVMPTFTFGRIFAVYNDDTEVELTLNASTNGYTISPAIGSTLQPGNTTVVIQSTVSVQTYSYQISVIYDYPKSTASLTVLGLDQYGHLPNYLYARGEKLIKDGLVVLVSEMNSGEKDKAVDDFTLQIRNQNTDTFANNLSFGSYDIVVSVPGVNTTSILENAVILDGPVSISGLESTKTYKSGETLDKEAITGNIVYSGGSRRAIQKKDIETEVSTLHYGVNESVPMTIADISATLSVTIKKVTALTVTLKSGGFNAYNYGQAFDRNNYTAELTYSDGSTESIDISKLTISGINEGYLESTTSSASVSVGFSYTEDSYEVTTSVEISVKRIHSIVLLDQQANSITKLTYNHGDHLDLTDYYVYIRYNDDTDAYIYDNNIQVTKNNQNITGSVVTNKITGAVITARCGTDVQTVDLTIHVIYLSALSVDFSSIPTLYAYEKLDLSEVTAEATYSCSDDENESYPQTETVTSSLIFVFNGMNVNDIEEYQLPDSGTYTLRAIYKDGSQVLYQEETLTILAIALSQITVHTSGAFKPLNSYVVDEYLDLTGLTVDIEFNQTSSNRLDVPISNYDIKLVNSTGGAVQKSVKLTNAYNNVELFVQYTYNNVTRTASIGTLTVASKALTSIEIVQNPTKTTFTYGDVFSIEGAVVKANFNNGTNETVGLNQLEVSGVQIGHTFNPTNDATFGSITITFSYTYNEVEKTATYTISLVAPKIDHLETNANDDSGIFRRTYQDLTAFSESLLVVTAVMQNGWSVALQSFLSNATTVLNITNGVISVSGDYGVKTITVSGTNPYDNTDSKTVTYDIEVVSSGQVINASLKLENDYNSYIVGDKFTAKGVSFVVTDIDGNTWVATNFTTDPSIGSVLRSAQRITIKATYINGSYSKTEEFSIVVSIPASTDVVDTNNYQLAIGKSNGDLFESIVHEEATIKFGKVYDSNGYLTGEFYPLFHEDKISIDDNPTHVNTAGYNVYTGVDAEHDCIGYIDFGNGDARNAHVVLFEDPINPIEGDSNIEVLFPHHTPGNAEKINKCKFGIVYNNRLFVSGNEDMPNIDFHSSETNNEKNEFTYFSDLDYCKYGTDHNPVVGYGMYRDGDLLVFKKGSRIEATVYKRQIKLSQAIDYAGNTLDEGLGEENYPCFPINSFGGIGAISNRSISNFFGETLVLTEEGLKAITSKENVYGESKYSFDVSTYINPRMLKESLEYAFLFSFKDKIYLRTNRGIYVGYQDIRNENGEYEWYFLSGILADIFFELDKQLYFANNNGGIYRVRENTYSDRPRIFVGVGGTTLSIDEANNKVIVSGQYEANIKEGNSFHVIADLDDLSALPTTQIHASLGSFINENTRINKQGTAGFDQTIYVGIIDPTSDTIEVKPYKANGTIDENKKDTSRIHFYEGLPIYLDEIVGHGLKVAPNTLYYLRSYETETDKYQLENEQGEVMDLAGVETMRVSYNIGENKLTRIHNVEDYLDTNGKQFELLGDHNTVLDLIYYNDKDDCEYKGVITMPKPVEAFYVTPPYVLGSALNMKTVWNVSCVNDTGLASAMEIGYLSSHKQSDYGTTINTATGSTQFSFEGLSFERIQFVNDGLPHIYQRYKVIPRVGFIRFLFRNNEGSNLIVSSLSIVYSHSQFTKGEM